MPQFYGAWKKLSKEEFDHEWDSENIVFYFSSAYQSKRLENSWRDIMFEMLPEISSVKQITIGQLNPKNPDYYRAEGLFDLQEKIAYMTPPKDVFGLVKRFKSNKPLFMPMVIKDGDTYKTISGRTRMSVAFLMDCPVMVIVIDKKKFRDLVILPIKREKYLSSDTFFTKSSATRQKLLDYVDGEISLEELRKDKELSAIDDKQLEFEISMAQRHSFKPETKENPTMKKSEQKLLGSAPTLEMLKDGIAKYWYTNPDKIILVQKSDDTWSIYQEGDPKYMDSHNIIHENGLRKMPNNFVEFKKGRYRFMSSTDTKTNPIKVKKGPREYGVRDGSKLNLTQALEVRDNNYRTRDAQHDYDPESVDARIYELQSKQSSRQGKISVLKRFIGRILWIKKSDNRGVVVDANNKEYYFDPSMGNDVFNELKPNMLIEFEVRRIMDNVQVASNIKIINPERIKIKLRWQEGPNSQYAHLTLPDFPFYSVRLYAFDEGSFKAVALIDNNKVAEFRFSGLSKAVEWAERKFMKMVFEDHNYDVSIMDK